MESTILDLYWAEDFERLFNRLEVKDEEKIKKDFIGIINSNVVSRRKCYGLCG